MSYTLLQQFNSQHVHILFNGHFRGKSVIWDTQLFTVAEFIRQSDNHSKPARQFIKIEQIDYKSMMLTVALNVPEINSPTIHKMMIMIKQYKRLSTGCHEYGEALCLNTTKEGHK